MRYLLLPCLLLAGTAGAAWAAPSPAPSASPAPRAASPAPSASPSPAPRTYLGLPTQNRVIAASLSLAVNGWGQHYNGEPEKGNLMMASLLTFPVAYGLDYLTGGAYMRVFSFTVISGIKAWSVVDAYQRAVPPPVPVTAPSPSPSPARK